MLTWRPYTAAIMMMDIKGNAPLWVETITMRYTSCRWMSIRRTLLNARDVHKQLSQGGSGNQ